MGRDYEEATMRPRDERTRALDARIRTAERNLVILRRNVGTLGLELIIQRWGELRGVGA